jgi:hypothetical protein
MKFMKDTDKAKTHFLMVMFTLECMSMANDTVKVFILGRVSYIIKDRRTLL